MYLMNFIILVSASAKKSTVNKTVNITGIYGPESNDELDKKIAAWNERFKTIQANSNKTISKDQIDLLLKEKQSYEEEEESLEQKIPQKYREIKILERAEECSNMERKAKRQLLDNKINYKEKVLENTRNKIFRLSNEVLKAQDRKAFDARKNDIKRSELLEKISKYKDDSVNLSMLQRRLKSLDEEIAENETFFNGVINDLKKQLTEQEIIKETYEKEIKSLNEEVENLKNDVGPNKQELEQKLNQADKELDQLKQRGKVISNKIHEINRKLVLSGHNIKFDN